MFTRLGNLFRRNPAAATDSNGGAAGKQQQQQQDFPPPNLENPTPVPSVAPWPLTGPQVAEKGYLYTIAGDDDFIHFRELCDTLDGWALRYDRDGVYAWDLAIPGAPMRLIKVFGVFDEPPEKVYDMLQDADFRVAWDTNRLDSAKLARLGPTCDVAYYAAKVQPPVSNRDFVNMRCWRNCGGGEYLIMSTSVPHPDMPPKPKLVRAICYVSGYLLRPWGTKGGCSLTYVSQTNPKGWLPGAFMNTLTAKLGPNVVSSMRKALQTYPAYLEKVGAAWCNDWVSDAVPFTTPPRSLVHEWVIAHEERKAAGVALAPEEAVVDDTDAPPAGAPEQVGDEATHHQIQGDGTAASSSSLAGEGPSGINEARPAEGTDEASAVTQSGGGGSEPTVQPTEDDDDERSKGGVTAANGTTADAADICSVAVADGSADAIAAAVAAEVAAS